MILSIFIFALGGFSLLCYGNERLLKTVLRRYMGEEPSEQFVKRQRKSYLMKGVFFVALGIYLVSQY